MSDCDLTTEKQQPWPRSLKEALLPARAYFHHKELLLANNTSALVTQDKQGQPSVVTLLAPIFLMLPAEVARVKESGDLVSVLALLIPCCVSGSYFLF